MKRLYLNVSVLGFWDLPDDTTSEEAQEIVDNFLAENNLTDIYNDAEWDLLPLEEYDEAIAKGW